MNLYSFWLEYVLHSYDAQTQKTVCTRISAEIKHKSLCTYFKDLFCMYKHICTVLRHSNLLKIRPQILFTEPLHFVAPTWQGFFYFYFFTLPGVAIGVWVELDVGSFWVSMKPMCARSDPFNINVSDSTST